MIQEKKAWYTQSRVKTDCSRTKQQVALQCRTATTDSVHVTSRVHRATQHTCLLELSQFICLKGVWARPGITPELQNQETHASHGWTSTCHLNCELNQTWLTVSRAACLFHHYWLDPLNLLGLAVCPEPSCSRNALGRQLGAPGDRLGIASTLQ